MKINDITRAKYFGVCCIYKITNSVNDKVYVGSTSNFYMRINKHKSCIKHPTSKAGRKNPMYDEFNKMGLDQIDIEIIELCTSETKFEREKYYTKLYQSDVTGYNIKCATSQPDSVRQKLINCKITSTPVCQYTKTGVLVAEYPSTHEAERQTGIAQQNICACCKHILYKSAGGYIWSYKK